VVVALDSASVDTLVEESNMLKVISVDRKGTSTDLKGFNICHKDLKVDLKVANLDFKGITQDFKANKVRRCRWAWGR
jgi:hypothetical protein